MNDHDDPRADAPNASDADPTDEHELEARADAAARLAELSGRVADLESALEGAQKALDDSEQRRAVDTALLDAGATDLETARLLVEAHLKNDADADPADAVARVKRKKPLLFRATTGAPSPMAARPAPANDGLDGARKAAEGGDRQSLLRYLRLRRQHA